MKKRIGDTQKHGNTSESGAAKARLARRAMGGAGKTSASRILTENELKTKKWLDRKIADINTREEAVDTLRKQCEQQLALINRKEALEQEKLNMEKSIRDDISGTYSHENGNGKEGEDNDENRNMNMNMNGNERDFSKEEMEALQDIEDRLDSVEGQLKLRDRNILEIESKLGSGDIASAQENTVEALKRISAVSLPASHELIRLLFDMLVSTKSLSHQRKGMLIRSDAREKQLKHDLDDSSLRITALMRAHDIELTRLANEYEIKLLGLFTHSTIGKLVILESGTDNDNDNDNHSNSNNNSNNNNNDDNNNNNNNHNINNNNSTSNNDNIINSDSPSKKKSPTQSQTSSVGRYRNSAEASYKMLLSVATEQSNLLRSRLEREANRSIELQSRLDEADHKYINLHRVLEDKDINIKFLEDERALFRDLADRLRSGISTLGGEAGSIILKQIKEREHGVITSDESENDNDNDDDNDSDSDNDENILGEYSQLGEIINRTGNVIDENDYYQPSKYVRSVPSTATAAVTAMLLSSETAVYDRLTNQNNNITESMKNGLSTDLREKGQKEKVQQTKSGQSSKRNNVPGFVMPNTRGHRNKEHIAAYLDGGIGHNGLGNGNGTGGGGGGGGVERSSRSNSITSDNNNSGPLSPRCGPGSGTHSGSSMIIRKGNGLIADNNKKKKNDDNDTNINAVRKLSSISVNISKDAAFTRTSKIAVRTSSRSPKCERLGNSLEMRENIRIDPSNSINDKDIRKRSNSDSFIKVPRPSSLNMTHTGYQLRSRSVIISGNANMEGEEGEVDDEVEVEDGISSEIDLKLGEISISNKPKNVNGMLSRIWRDNDDDDENNSFDDENYQKKEIEKGKTRIENLYRDKNENRNLLEKETNSKKTKNNELCDIDNDNNDDEEDENDLSEDGSHHSVTSLGVASINSNNHSVNTYNSNMTCNTPTTTTTTTTTLISREEKHLMKIKNRLQSATSSQAVISPRSTPGRRYTISSSPKTVNNLNK